MDPGIERALKALEESVEWARTHRFELTDDYLALIASVEAMPRNQSGARKSGRWAGGRAERERPDAATRPTQDS